MEHKEVTSDGVAGADIRHGEPGGAGCGPRASVSVNTEYLYPEAPVDGELISWPYICVTTSRAQLEPLRADLDGVLVNLARE